MDNFRHAHAERLPDVLLPYRLYHAETGELLRGLLANPEIADYLAFLRGHHEDSYEHCLRVGALCLDLALDRTHDHEELRIIGAGGLLHDLGKCDIAEELLSSPSILSLDERLVMQSHARAGFDRLSDDHAFVDVRNIVVSHHEWKTHPYPRTGIDRRAAERNDAERRQDDEATRARTAIVAVADMLDALSCARSYKAALSSDEVERIMREQFTGDPALIDGALRRL